MTFDAAVVVVALNVDKSESDDGSNEVVVLKIDSSVVKDASKSITSWEISRRGRIVCDVIVVVKISFLFDIVDGKIIKVDRIAPSAINKCNHRIDVNDGRVHKRLYNVSIPTNTND